MPSAPATCQDRGILGTGRSGTPAAKVALIVEPLVDAEHGMTPRFPFDRRKISPERVSGEPRISRKRTQICLLRE